MVVDFPFPNPETNLSTTSWKTYAQLTLYSPNIAPKMVLPTSLVILFGFSGYKIGTINSETLFFLGSIQLLTVCPSLGFMEVSNLPSTYFSVLPASILPSFRKP